MLLLINFTGLQLYRYLSVLLFLSKVKLKLKKLLWLNKINTSFKYFQFLISKQISEF